MFLGHNGAGKTTIFYMLTGMTSITSGFAKIYGYDVKNDQRSLRKIMGICPQRDVLYPELTVKQHLQFIGRIKVR